MQSYARKACAARCPGVIGHPRHAGLQRSHPKLNVRARVADVKTPQFAEAIIPHPSPIKVEPFSGCNCYYLLEKACWGGDADKELVVNTLKGIKQMGFTVIRMWAFQEDPKKPPLHNRGKLNTDYMKRLDWLMEQVQKVNKDIPGAGDLKLMMVLGNRLNNYGGMCQYVEWANEDQKLPSNNLNYVTDDWERWNPIANQFYDNQLARGYYKTFVTNMVGYYSKAGDGRPYSDLIHSWDICNEPRMREPNNLQLAQANASKVSTWLHEIADHVRSLDPTTPITCGSEGFFKEGTKWTIQGPWSKGAASNGVNKGNYNPYTNTEGCDFMEEFKPNEDAKGNKHFFFDFACIHMYPDQWLKGKSSDWVSTETGNGFAKDWVEAHMEACEELGIPLVLQEYNILRDYPKERVAVMQEMSKLLQESLKGGGQLVGNMIWMIADPGYPDYDSYTVYPAGDQSKPEQVQIQKDQCEFVKQHNKNKGGTVSGKPPGSMKAAAAMSRAARKPDVAQWEGQDVDMDWGKGKPRREGDDILIGRDDKVF